MILKIHINLGRVLNDEIAIEDLCNILAQV
jgi:hypothetical protein